MTNPLLGPWTGPFELPPFALIRDEDFAPAFDTCLAEARRHIAAIAGNPAAPTFANTIEAMELAEDLLDRVSGVFFNLASSDATPARQALEKDLAPKLAAFSSEVTMNPALWSRIETLWQGRDGLGLSREQVRLLELYHRMFRRAGAALPPEGRARIARRVRTFRARAVPSKEATRT